MNRIAALGAAAVLLLGAAMVVAAASPAPSSSPKPSATPQPSPTTAPSATPKPSSAPSTSGGTFSATVKPLEISGTATVHKNANGTGTVTLKLMGFIDEQQWFVDIDGGTIEHPNERADLAFKSGSEVSRVAPETIRVQLSRTEMRAFVKAEANGGVVAEVSDGFRVGYAEFTSKG